MTVRTGLFDAAFHYVPDFLELESSDDLTAFLDGVPRVEQGAHDGTRQFAFTRPRVDGTTVTGRYEAAAGNPVWTGSVGAPGVAIPAPLVALAKTVSGRLRADRGGEPLFSDHVALRFTSVYVDRYETGGAFVAHADRPCYGPVVAGVSVGTGACRLTFRLDGEAVYRRTLAPGSLYAFTGILREPPCTHEVDSVTGLRYGVTFRTAAPPLSPAASFG